MEYLLMWLIAEDFVVCENKNGPVCNIQSLPLYKPKVLEEPLIKEITFRGVETDPTF